MRPIRLGLALVCFLAVGAYPAGAQAPPDLDVRIERDTRPMAALTELGVFHKVTLIDRATGKPPAAEYEVFGQAANAGGEQTLTNECEEENLNDPTIPPRIYRCPVFVD